MSEALKKLRKEIEPDSEMRKEEAWTRELLKTGDLAKAAAAKRREEQKIGDKLNLAKKRYCEELRGIITFVTERFTQQAKEEDVDAQKYKVLADRMDKAGIHTAGLFLSSLAKDEEEHARRLRAFSVELIAELEKKLRLYKWAHSK